MFTFCGGAEVEFGYLVSWPTSYFQTPPVDEEAAATQTILNDNIL